jgi:alpha-D-xyloside xylohydrolase
MQKKTLSISDRKGSFPGMLRSRKFNIVSVTINKGVGGNLVSQPDKVVTYTGKKLTIKL